RSVLPIFGKHVAAEVKSPSRVGLISRERLARAVRRSELRVHRTARRDAGVLLLGDRNVAVGGEPFAGTAVSPAASATTAEHRHAPGAEAATLDEQPSHRPVRPEGDELDDTAKRI